MREDGIAHGDQGKRAHSGSADGPGHRYRGHRSLALEAYYGAAHNRNAHTYQRLQPGMPAQLVRRQREALGWTGRVRSSNCVPLLLMITAVTERRLSSQQFLFRGRGRRRTETRYANERDGGDNGRETIGRCTGIRGNLCDCTQMLNK